MFLSLLLSFVFMSSDPGLAESGYLFPERGSLFPESSSIRETVAPEVWITLVSSRLYGLLIALGGKCLSFGKAA